MEEKLWIAFVHLRPGSPESAISRGAKGAYANAMAMATNQQQFEEKVRKAVEEYGLELIEIEDVQTFAERVEDREVSSELRALAESIKIPGKVYFDAFYDYFSDDEVQ